MQRALPDEVGLTSRKSGRKADPAVAESHCTDKLTTRTGQKAEWRLTGVATSTE